MGTQATGRFFAARKGYMMSEFLDMLLRSDCPNVLKNLPTKKVECVTMSKRLGVKAVFTIRALPYGKAEQIRGMHSEQDTNLHILLNGCVEPDWRDSGLLNPAEGIVTPLDAIQSRMLAGEIADLAMAIEKLSGFRQNTLKEVKNG